MRDGGGTLLRQLEIFFGNKDSLETCIRLSTVVLLLLCVFTRACVYIFAKDIWLDEAFLYNAISPQGWSDLLRGRLAVEQSAPLLFVLLNKYIISHLGRSTAWLYFFPFCCSLLSVLALFLLTRKIGKGFYVFATLLLFSFCITPVYYAGEFKPYSTDMLVSLLLLSAMVADLKGPETKCLSFKYLLLYAVCILFSSPAVLFLAGLLGARVLIAWRRKALKEVCAGWWRLCLLLAFIAAYYFFYLRGGNTESIREYFQWTLIPLSWDAFLHYWPTLGLKIAEALFPSFTFTVVVFLGVAGGCPLLWWKRKDLFLLLSLPVLVTLAANCVFYPPGHGGQHGGRLLLFLLPNAVLVAGCFYAWLLKRLAALLGVALPPPPMARGDGHSVGGRALLSCIVFALVVASAVSNAQYLYARGYHVQQMAGLVRDFRSNTTPHSLNLVYDYAEPAYRYYQRDAPELPIEVVPRDLASLKKRLSQLPPMRRVLILLSHYWDLGEQGLVELEALFAAQGRECIKIPAKGAVLYILPKMQ